MRTRNGDPSDDSVGNTALTTLRNANDRRESRDVSNGINPKQEQSTGKPKTLRSKQAVQ